MSSHRQKFDEILKRCCPKWIFMSLICCKLQLHWNTLSDDNTAGFVKTKVLLDFSPTRKVFPTADFRLDSVFFETPCIYWWKWLSKPELSAAKFLKADLPLPYSMTPHQPHPPLPLLFVKGINQRVSHWQWHWLELQGAPKKMHHSDLHIISLLEIGVYFFTCVL